MGDAMKIAKHPYRHLRAVSRVGTVVTFSCENGHAFKMDMAHPNGKRHPGRLDEAAVEKLFGWWQSNNALRGSCPRCEKE